ncbi:acetyl-CoA carboxylase biotin carboxylase subunit family protein [Fibrobacter succinogenes]|uniref:ATP-grasp domain-containing protein n=1 Tax=Fibrobacter succinogenes TaxID=833 RepID=UPI0026F01828|nr:ATP-grasp domain-containing protein [Fibrobacter succinogenes]
MSQLHMRHQNSKTQNKLLLLGGSHAEIPLIKAAQELGWYVITTGNNRDGLGHPYADKTVFADFSDKEAMLELARAEGVQAVCSGCNDFALLSTVYICEKLGLPGHDSYATSLEIHHKDKYRALATRLGIPTPKAITVKVAGTNFAADQDEIASKVCADFETAIAQLTYPIIVKPVDLTGGKGIHRAATIEEARTAYKDACSRTRQDHVVVEEFVEGSNHGFSAMLVKGKVAFAFADNEQYFINKYLVSGANTPSTSGSATLAKLRDYSERIAHELNLVDGILHIQYIERADGTPIIIEICRRSPGDLYIKFVKYATGIDYPKFIVMAETGEDISSITDVPTQGFWLRHCVMAGNNIENSSVVRDVTFAPEIQGNIVEKFLWYKPGEVVSDKLIYKAGIVFFKFDTLAEMQDKTARMPQLAQIITE